jgi:hypothetical protein
MSTICSSSLSHLHYICDQSVGVLTPLSGSAFAKIPIYILSYVGVRHSDPQRRSGVAIMLQKSSILPIVTDRVPNNCTIRLTRPS